MKNPYKRKVDVSSTKLFKEEYRIKYSTTEYTAYYYKDNPSKQATLWWDGSIEYFVK